MDDVPTPDYSDYFRELQETRLSDRIYPVVLVETSRGCWKGHRHPCTFCGLNGTRSHFRSRTPERAAAEFDLLHERYGADRFMATDTIMNMKYCGTLLRDLATRRPRYRTYFESVSELTEAQVAALADAGICWIQAGTESLSDEILRLFNKRTSALRNIETLKYAREHAVKVSWNMLYGVPGATDDAYDGITRLIPLLHHLEAPSHHPIRFERFSAYVADPARFGLRLRPLPFYRHIYPFPEADLPDFAYFFDDERRSQPQARPERPAEIRMCDAIGTWRRAYYDKPSRPRLVIEGCDGGSIIRDTRACATSSEHALDRLDTTIYEACRGPATLQQIQASVSVADGAGSETIVPGRLARFLADGLAIQLGDTYLALATRPFAAEPIDGFLLNRYSPLTIDELRTRQRTASTDAWDWFSSLPS